jgi:XrtJ-associated TM-motif-TM protein
MKKPAFLSLGIALLLAVALPLHAQGGCANSPENPTAILAVVGSAGAFFASARARIKASRRSSK